MSYFNETVQAYLEGAIVRASILVFLDFASGPMRLWTGSGILEAGGNEWSGIGEVGSISGLDAAIGGTAPETTFVLSGVDPEIVSAARDEFSAEAKDRLAQVFLQFHNSGDDEPILVLDNPYAIWSGRMQTAKFEIEGERSRTISIEVESLFALRSRPAFSQYTSSDQQQRYPGDLGFDFVPELLNKVVTWPDF